MRVSSDPVLMEPLQIGPVQEFITKARKTRDFWSGSFLLSYLRAKRYALTNARIMIHQPLGGFHGQATDIQIRAREMLRVKDKLNRILADATGQPFERVEADTERDNFMSAEEALEYRIIDRIIARSDESY